MIMEKCISIRRGRLADLQELRELFAGTVTGICQEDYNESQINAWINGAYNWNHLFTQQYLLVAQEEGTITGFCSLTKDGCVDLFYIHKDHQGKGIARTLYNCLEEEASDRGLFQLTANVSITARYFFEKMGFDMLAEQTLIRQGVELNNFKMRKALLSNVRSIVRYSRSA